MPIISAIDNANNRWKRNAKKKTKRDKKRTSETVAMVKEWELNDFAVRLS